MPLDEPVTTEGLAEQKKQESVPLVKQLLKFKSENDLGALAELRRGAGQYPMFDERVYRRVAGFLPNFPGPRENAMLTVATLFGLCPTDGDPDVTFGETMRKVSDGRSSESGGMEIDAAIERRFMALLGADPDDLHVHLRHAMTLAEQAGVNVGWTRLIGDLTALLGDEPEWRSQVVRRWARDFWRRARPDDENDKEDAPKS